jgi:RNA polymerase sigma-70 factor (ECF subfamily)
VPLVFDRATVERARSDAGALDALIGAVWPEAYRLALTVLRDHGLAEDAAQEACAAIVRFLPSLKDPGAFRTWSYKIIARHALDAARRRPRTTDLDTLCAHAIDSERSDALDLYAGLAALTPLQRTTILLHYYAGLRSQEIGEAIGIPPSTVRFHLMLARRALRKALGAATLNRPYNEVLSDVH